MVYQTQWNSYVAYKVQSALGTLATGAGAKVLRTAGGTPGKLTKNLYGSREVRRDGLHTRGRHGLRRTQGGPYSQEWSLGLADDVLEAVFRGAYTAADLVITEATASLTSITTTTNTIVAGAGSWITAGVRVGEVWRLTNHSTAANNGKNLPILGVTASTLTVPAGFLTTNAVADTAFTLTRTGRKLVNPLAGALTNRYFTVEEHEVDIDSSELFQDCMWGGFKFSMQPDGILMFEPTWTGTGVFTAPTGAGAPNFTSPTETTAIPMACVDASIYLGSTPLVDLTAFELSFDIAPVAPGVIANTASPDVFPGGLMVQGSITGLRADLSQVSNFLNESALSLFVLAVENEAEPKDFISIYLPNFTLGGTDKSALSREGGPRTQTLTIASELVGVDTTGGAFDQTMAKFQVSNAT